MNIKKILLTAITAFYLTIILHAQVPSYVPSNGLVAWYPFNGNANDESGNGNNGINNGATLTVDRNNIFGKAYNFDGLSAYIKLQNSDSILFQNGITFSAWIMPTDYKNSSIIDRMTNTGSSFRISTRDNSGNAITPRKIWAQGGNYVDGTIKANSISNIQLNVWQFVVGSYGIDDTIRIYINGILENKVYLQGHVLNQYTPIFIGRGSTTNTYELFSGSIDDIGIWKRAITQLEVTKLYNSSATNVIDAFRKSDLIVYPNPASNQLNIQSNFQLINAEYIISDLFGNTILQGMIMNENTNIEIANFSKGIYLLTVKKDAKQTFKIVKN